MHMWLLEVRSRMPANRAGIPLDGVFWSRVRRAILHLLEDSLVERLLAPASDDAVVHHSPSTSHHGLRTITGAARLDDTHRA